MELRSQPRLIRKLKAALGPQVLDALDDPQIVEIILNPDGRLFAERLGHGFEELGHMAPDKAEIVIGTIAHATGLEVDQNKPVISSKLLLGGHRFEGLLPPIVERPSFAIRCKSSQQIALAAFAPETPVGQSYVRAIRGVVHARKNIVICGGTGSGKTTLANAILAEIATITPSDRLVILEDTEEIVCAAQNATRLLTSDDVDMGRLLKSTLRLRPDRIVVGEVRDGAALTLLKAWNTGHPGGITTIHANSARAGLGRIEQLVGEVSARPQQQFIADAVDIILFVERTPKGREIREMVEVNGFCSDGYAIQQLEMID